MLPTLKWDTETAQNFAELVRIIPDGVLDSPFRSVVPLVDYFRGPVERSTDLGRALGLNLGAVSELAFEYAVPVQMGRGKPSFTDLMIGGPDVTVAIEAKRTEPRYESVRTWRGTSSNRSEVLNGWLSLLNRTCGSAVTADAVLDLPYQLVHRSASACVGDTERRVLVYVVFGDGVAEHYVNDVTDLDRMLNHPEALSMSVIKVPVRAEAAQAALEARWNQGERGLSAEVRRELLLGPVFSYGSIGVEYLRM